VTRRGQTESSFQWVFVLVAGIALLLMLLGFMRSCSQSAQQEGASGDLRSAASRLSSVAWQGASQQNVTLPDADVVCRAGVITLETGSAQTGLDRAPIYLPPAVGGRAQVVTRDLVVGAGTPAPFPVGGVAYALDEKSMYLVVQDSAGASESLLRDLPASPLIARVGLRDLTDAQALANAVKGSPRTIVLVISGSEADLANADVSAISSLVDVRGVALQQRTLHGGIASFYKRDAVSGKLSLAGSAPYAHKRIAVGMVVSADRELSRCATDAIADRARTIVAINAFRADALVSETRDPVCGQLLEQGAELLMPIALQEGTAPLLDALFSAERDIVALQGSMLTRPGECPGVA
jgi:hypothetical protein